LGAGVTFTNASGPRMRGTFFFVLGQKIANFILIEKKQTYFSYKKGSHKNFSQKMNILVASRGNTCFKSF
jgi:hypothetical protein